MMMSMLRHMGYPGWRVRAMPHPGMVPVKEFFLYVLGVPLHLLHSLVELVALLGAVVLEAHHRVDAAYSRECQRHEQEDGSAIALLFLDLVLEG